MATCQLSTLTLKTKPTSLCLTKLWIFHHIKQKKHHFKTETENSNKKMVSSKRIHQQEVHKKIKNYFTRRPIEYFYTDIFTIPCDKKHK